MLFSYLLASDFPSENPRTQTRNFSYTQSLNETPFALGIEASYHVTRKARPNFEKIW